VFDLLKGKLHRARGYGSGGLRKIRQILHYKANGIEERCEAAALCTKLGLMGLWISPMHNCEHSQIEIIQIHASSSLPKFRTSSLAACTLLSTLPHCNGRSDLISPAWAGATLLLAESDQTPVNGEGCGINKGPET
jgi:hypothetical protein